ncbi:MAG TPA: hypothetical protein VJN92_17815 [Candidatus Acidoferrum sp.]|nr:hypothetical protein [Candidatus Acidoferrum sp.]
MSGVKDDPPFSHSPDSALTFVHELSGYSVLSECWKDRQEADFPIIAYERPMTKQYASHQLSIEKGRYTLRGWRPHDRLLDIRHVLFPKLVWTAVSELGIRSFGYSEGRWYLGLAHISYFQL